MVAQESPVHDLGNIVALTGSGCDRFAEFNDFADLISCLDQLETTLGKCEALKGDGAGTCVLNAIAELRQTIKQKKVTGEPNLMSDPLTRTSINRDAPKTATTPMQAATPIDLPALKTETGDEAFSDILTVFVASTAGLIREAEQAIFAQNVKQARGVVSELMSSCTVIGAPRMIELCRQMDELITQERWIVVGQRFSEMVRELDSIRKHVANC